MPFRQRALLRPFAFVSLVLWGAFTGCASGGEAEDEQTDEGVLGSVSEGLRKGSGGVNCDGNYCKGSVLCVLGEGDCDVDTQCDQTTAAGPLRCIQNNGAKWGCVSGLDVCAPATCINRVLDPGETQVDCGGSCGPICPQVCVGLPANGSPGHCTVDCPCQSGEGDCNGNTTCTQNGPLGALVCPAGNGAKFGFSSAIEMCVPAHCTNKLLDAALGETSRDCGGDCGTVCTSVCGQQPPSGSIGHCTAGCPCNFKDGDCDVAGQCAPGGVCLQDRGDLFGFSPSTDVCVASHCVNASQDGGESAVDCGGPDCAACAGGVVDAASFGGSATDYAQEIGLDAAGNIYLGLRYVSSSFDIGLGDVGNAGESDVLLAKLSPQGVPLWNHRVGNALADGDHNVALAVDAAGNSYLVASFYGSVNAGGADLAASGEVDVYVAKYDTNGNHVWSKSFGGSGLDRLRRLVFDPAGDLILVGYFESSIVFGATTLTSAGSYDAYVAKLSAADGSPIWARGYGSTLDDRGYGIATDSSGNIYVAGQVTGTVDLGLGPFTTSNSLSDGFLMKLSNAGTTLLATTFGGTTRGDFGAVVGVDSSGRPVMGARFTSNLDFGSGVFDPALSDVAVIGYNADLTQRWSHHFGGPGHDTISDFVVAPSGEVAITGYFGTSIDFGGGSVAALGSVDTFLVRYGSGGSVVWSSTFGSGSVVEPMGLALGAGTLYLTGFYQGTVAFGSASVGPSIGGSRDGFLTQFVF